MWRVVLYWATNINRFKKNLLEGMNGNEVFQITMKLLHIECRTTLCTRQTRRKSKEAWMNLFASLQILTKEKKRLKTNIEHMHQQLKCKRPRVIQRVPLRAREFEWEWCPKLYIPSSVNTDYIFWHTQLIVYAFGLKWYTLNKTAQLTPNQPKYNIHLSFYSTWDT